MMDIKVIVPIIAVIVSVLSIFISVNQKRYETERTIREKLTDTFNKITELDIEFIKLEDNINKNINLTRVFNQKRRFLVKQALYFSSKIETLVSDAEFALLAGTLERFGDIEEADYYWKKSIERSSNRSTKIYNIRGYARFLFTTIDSSKGRKKYQEAIDLASKENDRDFYDIAETYILWATLEWEHGFPDRTEEYLDLSEGMINKIENRYKKTRITDYLNNVKKQCNLQGIS
ncbi:hypothetical protein KXS12_24285 [Priestia filamentosa]|uniref:hypothetical protein n=1 Tax=Priestia filamentosa TaxID=1402861 RepID=UPI003F1385CE